MEAILYNSDVHQFNTLLQQGSIYTLHGVVFGPNLGQLEFRNIEHRHELTLTRRTTVEPYTMPIQFPPYPKHLMPFHEVIEQPNKTFVGTHPSLPTTGCIMLNVIKTWVFLDLNWALLNAPDIMGVVVHLEPLEHMGRRSYREVMLMDSRYFSTSIVRKHVFCMHKQLRVLYDKISRWDLIVVGVVWPFEPECSSLGVS